MEGINNMLNDIKEILFSEEQLKETVNKLAEQVNKDYAGKSVLLVSFVTIDKSKSHSGSSAIKL